VVLEHLLTLEHLSLQLVVVEGVMMLDQFLH
jgi:hypothetical protein